MILTPDLVRSAGIALFGTQWRGPMARLLGVADREIRYIAKAAEDGTPYTPPAGWAAEIKAALAGVAASRAAQAQLAQQVMDALGDVPADPATALSEAERQRAAL